MKIFHVLRLGFFHFRVLEQDRIGFINWGTSWTRWGAHRKARALGADKVVYKRV